MIRNFFMILLLFIAYEGFLILPEKMVVPFPGIFRMSDSILLFIPLFFLFFFRSAVRSFNRFREESFLILSACALIFLGPLMAWFIFDQPYLTGLLLMRQNLFYLTFFMFVPLLRSRDQLDNFLNLLTFLFVVYIVILLVNKYFPNLRFISYPEGYYKHEGFMRFGEWRLYFPLESVPILLYCLALAGILHPPRKMSLLRKIFALVFILIFLFAILSTFVRILFISLLFTTVFALFTSNRRMLRNMAIVLTIIFVCVEVLAVAVSGGGISFIEDSKLGKIVMQGGKLPSDTARMSQVSMYINNFFKSPLAGVGYLKSGTTPEEILRTYRKHGFFYAVDIGYMKIAAENGMLGIAWVIWFYSYMYRRSKQTLKKALALGDEPMAKTVAHGLRYFLIYLVISGLTLAHFVRSDRIPSIVLALAIMAVTRESLRIRTAAPANREVGSSPA